MRSETTSLRGVFLSISDVYNITLLFTFIHRYGNMFDL